jgi:hypothetical protein
VNFRGFFWPGGYGPAGWQQDPFGQAQQRAAVRKLTSGPLWEVAIRYAAACTADRPRVSSPSADEESCANAQ